VLVDGGLIGWPRRSGRGRGLLPSGVGECPGRFPRAECVGPQVATVRGSSRLVSCANKLGRRFAPEVTRSSRRRAASCRCCRRTKVQHHVALVSGGERDVPNVFARERAIRVVDSVLPIGGSDVVGVLDLQDRVRAGAPASWRFA